MNNIPILVILGPTASGKSDLAVHIAEKIGTERIGGFKGAEIISADSRQVYRGMDIGTGKITRKEMRGIPHHLLDVAQPRNQFTVIHYKKLAEQAIANIYARGKLPIICGGTGFYIDAIVNGTEFPTVGANETLRKKLKSKSIAQLFKMLEKLDADRARKMNDSDSKNPRRLIRAIEVAKVETIEANKVAKKSPLPYHYDPILIGLKVPSEQLRKRIHLRLLKRIKSGMLAEARKLHLAISRGGADLSWKRMEELGLEYRYMARCLQGKITREEMIRELETEIWHYAKRQMTWFKRDKRIRWVEIKHGSVIGDSGDLDRCLLEVYNSLKPQ